ncbi:MAG: DnaD domain protein [Lachnospiraceae bacterium]|nr:DnaD domain protein [Lachnospiraceae bacterium]
MSNITITNESLHDVTIVSNVFIDEYMSDANGEYVKTYLYLLRAVATGDALSIVSIADKLNYTERDVYRALKFWQQKGILSLSLDSLNELTGIKLLPIKKPQKESAQKQSFATTSAAPKGLVPSSAALENSPQKHSFSLDEMAEFRTKTEVAEILCVAEQYLGKTLSNTDINSLLYIYDGLKFDSELIEYLIEYCVTNNHKSMHYIEKTAIGWSKEGITNAAQAKDFAKLYNDTVFTILNAFGIKNRHPAPVEQKMITVWTKDYGFSLDIIVEACNRTMKTVHTPSFEYTDKILARWKKKGVKTMSDIAALDQAFLKEQEQKKTAPKVSGSHNNSGNKFNNFSQRSYDYDKLERDLLKL